MFISTTSDNYNFSGHTLILPGITIGNIGQLVADLLISSASLQKIGYLDSPNVLPVVGNDTFLTNTEDKGELSINLEVFQQDEKKITVIQQRAPIIKGKTTSFVSELVNWIQENNFKEVLFIMGADASRRFDFQLEGSQIRFKSDNLKIEGPNWIQLEQPSEDIVFKKGSYSSKLLEKCTEKNIPYLTIIEYVNEGDNIIETINLSNFLNINYLNLLEKENTKWVFPNSWKYISGTTFSKTLFT